MEIDQLDEEFQPERPDESLYDFSYDDDGYNEKLPSGQAEDESNMSALDLYTDMVVRDSEEAALSMAKLKEEKTSFKAQLDVALLQVSKLSKENEALTKENKVLKSNISVLLKTAKTELQRKERELNELRDMQLGGMRPAGNALSPRSRKTRRGPKHRQPPALMRQNGAQHPQNTRDGNTARAINRRTGDSDGDDEQKPNVRETMFVRRQRAKNQQHSTGKLLQSSKVPPVSSDKRELDGGKKPIGDALMRLSQMSSQNKDKLNSRDTSVQDADESLVRGQKEPKNSETQKVGDVNSAVPSLEAQERKTAERYLQTVKERSRSKSIDRATRSRSGEKSSTKRSYDSSKHDQRKLYPRSPSRERSSRGQLDDKNLSPSRASRIKSNDKRSSRSKSRDRMSPRRSSRSKSHERRSSRSKSRERRSSMSKSHERTLHKKSHDKPRDIKINTKEISRRGSSSTSLDYNKSRSETDRLVKPAESLAYRRSSNDRGNITEKYRSNDRHRDRDRRDNRRSSTPIRDSARKDSKTSEEDQTKWSSVQMPSSSERDRRRLERGQSRARERLSSKAKESVARAKAMLNKRTSGYSSPKKTHRHEKDKRRSSRLPSLDGLTDWTKGESSHREPRPGEIRTDIKEDDRSLRRKKERRPEGSERKRKHRLSSSFQKQSQRFAKKRRAGSESDNSGRVDIADDDSLEASSTNTCTYEEGHTVLACGMRDSIECTSSKVTVLHTSVSDAYDTTQSEKSFLYASGLQGALKHSADDAGTMVNIEVKEDGELSEGEIVSDEEEVKGTNKSKHGSSEKKKRQSSKHKLSDHNSKSKENKKKTPKSARRGRKHKRRSSTDQEARERRKRLKENKKCDDSIQSQTEEAPSSDKDIVPVYEDDAVGRLVSMNISPPLFNLNNSEIAPKISDDNSDKEKDISVSNEKPSDDHLRADSEAEAIIMTPVSESAMQATGGVQDEKMPKTNTLSSPEEEMEDNRVSTVHDESGGERILESEDAVESDIVDANLGKEVSPEKAIPSPVKELNCADEPETRHEAIEADAYVSRGVLFEDLCLSSSMDDTSLLSCAEPNSEIQRHSFMNSIEKVDVVIKEIEDPLVNPSVLEMGKVQKPSEALGNPGTEISVSLGTTALDPHRIHVPPETISEPMPDPSKTGEVPCESLMEEAIPDGIVIDTTHQERINISHTDTSMELNISKSSELNCHVQDALALNDDKSKCAGHVSGEDNDAVSLLAASGELDSFMLDNTAPKVRRDFDLSLIETRDVLKEVEVADKSSAMLHLTSEWSNIEFQDSSTKMGDETELGPVSLAAPVFDDGCAQDMDYAKDPVDTDNSVLEKGEHELMNKTITGDEQNAIDIAENLKRKPHQIGERITARSNETSKGSADGKYQATLSSENATDSKSDGYRSAESNPLDLENKDKFFDTLATGGTRVGTVHQESCEAEVSDIISNSPEKRHSPVKEGMKQELPSSIIKEGEKEMEQVNLEQESTALKTVGKGERHVSYKPIVISDEDSAESELDFEEDAQEDDENDEEDDEDDDKDDDEEESVYIVDVQYANTDNRAAEQEDSSCFDSEEEEKEELNQSDSYAHDPGSKLNTLKPLLSPDEPSAVGDSKGKKKFTFSKGQSENDDNESELDWGSEPEDQNEMVGQRNICIENEDKDELPESEVKNDVSKDKLKGIETGYKDGQPVDMKEKIDGDQQNLVEDSEEEGEILEEDEEENIGSPDRGHNRKGPSEKSRTNQRQERDHKGFSHSHHHRDLRDSSKGNKDRCSDNHRLTTDGKGKRRRSGSTDRRPHRELPKRDSKTYLKREDRERTGRGRSDEERSRRTKDQRQETSDRRREEDRKKAAFLEKKREELLRKDERQRVERRRADERREARRLEDERRLHEERKRTRKREESEKVRSRLHDNDKKREPLRKSKKVSEGRRP